ncbi:MAG: hypothetical protein U0441_37615 [Polyangiaceae bacterium]
MEKAQLDALLAAHGGRPQPVASFHLLRSPHIAPAAHAFLKEHAASLATIDLSRWLDHASPEQRPDALEALIALAERDPSRFEFEIARAPHFPFHGDDRRELTIRLVGRAPESVIAALSIEPPPRRPSMRPGSMRPGSMRPGSMRPRAPSQHPDAPPSAGSTGSTDGGFTLGNEAFFDPGEILSEMGDDGAWASDLLADEAFTRPEPGLTSGDFLGLGDSPDGPGGPLGGLGDASDPLENKGNGAHSTSPELDSLLASLDLASSARARAAWKKRALAQASESSEDWAPSVARLPPAMRDAIARRAGESPRPDERAALLEWLLQNGAKRSALVDLTVSFLALDAGGMGAREWLAQSFLPRLLPDKAAWSKHGVTLLTALIDRKAFSEMDSFLAAAGAGAAALGPGLVAMPGGAPLTPAIGAALSATLIAEVTSALHEKKTKVALACAAALACLGVASKDRAAVSALRRKKSAKGETATLLALAETRALKPKQSPRLEDLVATVHVLSDAMS